ncbi:MAG: Uncharacterized protein FD166_1382 [Bacteroidetes bacterium]|nr:MAG: Uncharacterized protein FD166_1382 [Bacteroidota bacterium]
MFSNTSQLSFIIGSTFLIISLGWVIFIYYLIRKKLIEDARLDKMIDLGKWFIVSVGMVSLAAIITDSFKEREQDMKEIEVFDKYVSTITQVEGIEERWLLCEYFAAVSPEGQLKESWQSYQKILKHNRELFNSNNEKIKVIDSKDSITPEDEVKRDILVRQNTALDKSLVVVPPASKSNDEVIRIDIFYLEGNDALLNRANDLSSQIESSFYTVKVKMLKKTTNDQAGYRIKENQFRVDSPNEREIANELNNSFDLGFKINRGGQNPTPSYISIFIVS